MSQPTKTPTQAALLQALLLSTALLMLSIWLGYLALQEIKLVFVDKVHFVTTTSGHLIFLSAVTFSFRGVYFCIKRLMSKDKMVKIGGETFVTYFMGFSILATPLLLRPAMHSYLKSQTYERCWSAPGSTGLTSRLSPKWAKPSVGCEVWDLSDAERKTLRASQSN